MSPVWRTGVSKLQSTGQVFSELEIWTAQNLPHRRWWRRSAPGESLDLTSILLDLSTGAAGYCVYSCPQLRAAAFCGPDVPS